MKSKIEDFFEPKLLQTELGGKRFNPENTQDGDKGEYGKAIFAKYVRSTFKDIEFGAFQPLLTNITLAIEDYKKILASAA